MACLAFGVAAGAAVALSARRRARRDAPEEAWGQTSETTLRELSAVWRKDLLENVLPFWEQHSIDAEHGGFFTCLDRHGEVYDDRKYTWLQGRQVYIFARLFCELTDDDVTPARRRRWPVACQPRRTLCRRLLRRLPRAPHPPSFARHHTRRCRCRRLRIAREGAAFLERAKQEDGEGERLFFSTTREGAPLHFQRKPYGAVFYTMVHALRMPAHASS